jgi:hypothetical protein
MSRRTYATQTASRSHRVESSVHEGLGVCWAGRGLSGHWCLHIDEFGSEIVAGGGHTSKLSELFVFLRGDVFKKRRPG